MSGTKTGGLKASQTNLKKDKDFYKKIGHLGGSSKNPLKGFGTNRELARTSGAKGGAKSKRGKAFSPTIPVSGTITGIRVTKGDRLVLTSEGTIEVSPPTKKKWWRIF